MISSFNADISGNLIVLVKTITGAKIQWYINENGSFIPGKLIANEAAMTIDVYQENINSEVAIVAAEILNADLVYYYSDSRKVIDTGGGSYGAAFGDIDKDGLPDIWNDGHYLYNTHIDTNPRTQLITQLSPWLEHVFLGNILFKSFSV